MQEGEIVTFTTMIRSPISNVGYMERKGMKHGSMMKDLNSKEKLKVARMVLPSLDEMHA